MSRFQALSMLTLGGGLLLAGTARADYVSQVTAANPLAYYHFDETSGSSFADATGHGHGSATNSGTLGTPGVFGNDITFNGTAQSSKLSLTLDPNSTDFTIETLVKVSAITGSNQDIVQQTDAGGTGRTLLYVTGAGDFASFFGGTATAAATALTPGTWYHVALTVTQGASDTVKLYVNGSLAATGTVTGGSSTGNWLLGVNKNLASPFYFGGSLDELAIYNSALSDTTIANHAAAAFATVPTPAALPAGLALLGAVPLTSRRRRR